MHYFHSDVCKLSRFVSVNQTVMSKKKKLLCMLKTLLVNKHLHSVSEKSLNNLKKKKMKTILYTCIVHSFLLTKIGRLPSLHFFGAPVAANNKNQIKPVSSLDELPIALDNLVKHNQYPCYRKNKRTM